MIQDFYYNNTTVLIDPSCFESRPVQLPVDPSAVEILGYDGTINSYAHISPCSTVIYTPNVAWQISNNDLLPGQSVSAEDLLKQYPVTVYELKDSRDSSSSGGGTNSSIDLSYLPDASSPFWIDENNDQIPDAIQWSVLN